MNSYVTVYHSGYLVILLLAQEPRFFSIHSELWQWVDHPPYKPYGGVLSHRATSISHPFIDGISWNFIQMVVAI